MLKAGAAVLSGILGPSALGSAYWFGPGVLNRLDIGSRMAIE